MSNEVTIVRVDREQGQGNKLPAMLDYVTRIKQKIRIDTEGGEQESRIACGDTDKWFKKIGIKKNLIHIDLQYERFGRPGDDEKDEIHMPKNCHDGAHGEACGHLEKDKNGKYKCGVFRVFQTNCPVRRTIRCRSETKFFTNTYP